VTQPGSLVLLLTSPRVAPGLLTRAAWQVLEAADLVCCADPADPQPQAVAEAGLAVQPFPPSDPPPDRTYAHMWGPGGDLDRTYAHKCGVVARELVRRAGAERVVWIGSPDGDPGLTDALAAELSRVAATQDPPEVEVLVGSQDVPGARLLDVVAVMDRLRSPGGCPWDAEQTHHSLAPYLLEESYELIEAIELDDLAHLREELGDVLLQVAFHSRLAEERPEPERFSVDDVAADLVAKLVRRHPHVFAGREVTTAADLAANWEAIKAAEKRRESVTDGVPTGQPALALAAKLQRRARKAGLDIPAPAGDGLGARLFSLVGEAVAADQDPEAALRATARAYRDAVRAAETAPAADR
jgi:XTP/dITP diphosphohydrolase